MSSQDGKGIRGDLGRDAVQLVAGVVDLGLEQAEGLLRRARSVLGRADLQEIATDGQAELRARGELLLGRLSPTSEPHLETVARRAAAARRQPSDA